MQHSLFLDKKSTEQNILKEISFESIKTILIDHELMETVVV